jgi:hypothetical protein
VAYITARYIDEYGIPHIAEPQYPVRSWPVAPSQAAQPNVQAELLEAFAKGAATKAGEIFIEDLFL